MATFGHIRCAPTEQYLFGNGTDNTVGMAANTSGGGVSWAIVPGSKPNLYRILFADIGSGKYLWGNVLESNQYHTGMGAARASVSLTTIADDPGAQWRIITHPDDGATTVPRKRFFIRNGDPRGGLTYLFGGSDFSAFSIRTCPTSDGSMYTKASWHIEYPPP